MYNSSSININTVPFKYTLIQWIPGNCITNSLEFNIQLTGLFCTDIIRTNRCANKWNLLYMNSLTYANNR